MRLTKLEDGTMDARYTFCVLREASRAGGSSAMISTGAGQGPQGLFLVAWEIPARASFNY